MKIGIFSGTFDPIHKGHIEFALAAVQCAKLDAVYFLPEPKPRAKVSVTPLEERHKILQSKLKNHAKFKTLLLTDDQFSVKQTWPKILKRFKGNELYLLIGSDTAKNMSDWPGAKQLAQTASLIIGLRGDHQIPEIQQLHPTAIILNSPHPHLSSAQLRQTQKH